MVDLILSYLWNALSAYLIQILIVFGPGLALALVMNYVAGFVERRALLIMGRGWYLALFGWLGTVIHELGHALFCLLFGHKITDIKLFHPDPRTGTLGYVNHTYNPDSIYQSMGNFFIGIGPVLFCASTIYLLSYLLLGFNPLNTADLSGFMSSHPGSEDTLERLFSILWNASWSFLAEAFSLDNLSSWRLYVFIYLAFAIGSSSTLSPSDIKGALKGFVVILVLILIFNLATYWVGDFTANIIGQIAGYCRVFYAAMFLILLLNILVAVIILLPLSLLRAGQRR